MFEINVIFIDDSIKKYFGNFVLEGSFVRINYDHDENKRTPQRTIVIPAHGIKMIDCEVIQSGVSK